jgi:hypothetical protein
MAPYGVTANTIMPGANTRLAQIGWRMTRQEATARADGLEFDPRDPVHVAEFGCYLASPDAGYLSGQTFQVRGGIVEHVSTWRVQEIAQRRDRGFTADDYAQEVPRLFGAAAKRADPPPPEWTAARNR